MRSFRSALVALILALWAVPASATITFVRAGPVRDVATGTTHDMDVPADGHAVGNVLACGAAIGDDGVTVAFSDSKSNTWATPITVDNAGTAVRVALSWSRLSTALLDADTVTITLGTSISIQAECFEYTSDVGFLSTADTSNTKVNSFGTAWTTGSVTPTSGATVVAFAAANPSNVARTNTPAMDWTERQDDAPVSSGRKVVIQERIIATVSGSYDEGGSMDMNATTVAGVVVIREGIESGSRNRLMLGVGDDD